MGRIEVGITGIGALTPLGNDVETTWASALEGRSGISDIPSISPEIPFISPWSEIKYLGMVKGFDVRPILALYDQQKELRDLGRTAQLAIGVGLEALTNARLLSEGRLPNEISFDIGCLVGSGGADSPNMLEAEAQRVNPNLHQVKPSTTKRFGLEKTPGSVAKTFNLRGPSGLIAAACASSGEALIMAESLIKAGKASAILVIGTEGVLDLKPDGSMKFPVIVESYESMAALSTHIYDHPSKASRPFDYRRDGFLASEGAIGLVLEDVQHAYKRGVKPLATITTMSTNNASGDTNPDELVMYENFRLALKAAGIEETEIDLVIPHATSTSLGDISEKGALTKLFRDRIGQIPMDAIKSMTGHMLGGAGAMGILIAVKAITKGYIPPTLNFSYTEEIPESLRKKLGLSEKQANTQLWLPQTALQRRVTHVLNNSFGFAGHNAVSIVSSLTA